MTFDRSAEHSLQDYRDALAPQPFPADEANVAPDFQPVVAESADLKLPAPLVTVSVNQTVSLRELMFELAEQAGVDIELDPQIRGSIIFTAKDRPFNEVVDRICDMSGLRYKFKNNILRVELDRPYIKNYRVDHMASSRTSSSSINNSVSVSGSSGSTSTAAGSSSSISGAFSSNFWKEVDDGLKQLLTASDTYLSLATLADPVATPDAPPPPPPLKDPNNPDAPGVPQPQVAPQQMVPPPTLRVTAAPSTPLIPNPPATYSISKETGIVSVFASERQHKLVSKFLDVFLGTAMTQVLIEAKVLEVSLDDKFSTGIDWGTIGNKLNGAGPAGTITGPNVTAGYGAVTTGMGTSTFTANLSLGRMLGPTIKALSTFGTVRALSSPRVTVLNNQPAVVNVTRNRVYFTIQTTVSPLGGAGGGTTTTQNSTPQSSPEGVLLNVLPSANPETGEIVLAVRPTISKHVQDVVDPVNTGNSVPEMSVQEIDSILKMQSGQTLIMGGLMKDQNTVSREGLPVVSDLPYIGALFRNHLDGVSKTELVIMMQATIVPGSNVTDRDRKLYQGFSNDSRPSSL